MRQGQNTARRALVGRVVGVVGATWLLGACVRAVPFDPASALARAERCDMEHTALRPYKEQEQIRLAYGKAPKLTEIVVYTSLPPE